MQSITINPYHQSITKRSFDLSYSILVLIIFFPIILIISCIIKLTSIGPIIFTQKRVGLNHIPFKFYKFRTMKVGSEKLQKQLHHLNQADGPVFKISNDPRLTKFGKVLSKTGLDELPQLVNVIKGDMNLVGPRPLPVNEANKLTSAQKQRHLIKPGITSHWVVNGPHTTSFNQWMTLDLDYLKNATLKTDIKIMIKTVAYLFKLSPSACYPNNL